MNPHRRNGRAPRKGAALVEMSICLPVIVLLTFGAVESTNAIFLKQGVTEAAHEGARMASSVGKTDADARTRVGQILAMQGIQDSQVTIEPPVTATTPAGTRIRVTVSAPTKGNTYAGQWYFEDSILSGSVVMVRQ